MESNRGADVLQTCLRTQCYDLRQLDVAEFQTWLQRQLDRWEHDRVFLQRQHIRDLRSEHPEILRLEREWRRIVAADAASLQFRRLEQIEKRLEGVAKAIAGLSAAVVGAEPERQDSLQKKLDAFRDEQQSLQRAYARLVSASPERQRLLELKAQLEQRRAQSGLATAEAELQRLLEARGQRSGRSGESFEQTALQAVQQHVVPELIAADGAPLMILDGVRLGAARVELDQLVVRRRQPPNQATDVVAVVEVKRNINDLAHGFRRRQEDLAWLTGDRSRYDPANFRTRDFPTGHFDRPASYHHQDQQLLLTPESFARFERDRDTSAFTHRLYFVTRSGPLWGISSGGLARIAQRVASDRRWDVADDAYLRQLFGWARSLTHLFEAPDLLRLYSRDRSRARQILLLQ